jgi:hypothetical protein
MYGKAELNLRGRATFRRRRDELGGARRSGKARLLEEEVDVECI